MCSGTLNTSIHAATHIHMWIYALDPVTPLKIAQILAKSKHGFLVPILSPACPTWFSGRTGWAEDWHKKAESYGWIWLKFGIFCLCDIGNIWSIREGFMIEVYVNTEHSYKAQMHIFLSGHNFYKRKNHSRRIWNEFFFAKPLSAFKLLKI